MISESTDPKAQWEEFRAMLWPLDECAHNSVKERACSFCFYTGMLQAISTLKKLSHEAEGEAEQMIAQYARDTRTAALSVCLEGLVASTNQS